MDKINFHSPLFEITSPPGDTLVETLDVIYMSQADLARRMGRPLKTINEVVKGKVAITADTALQLEKVLNIPAGFWLRREQYYRETLARLEERKFLEGKLDWLDEFPVAAMIDLDWIQAYDEPVEQIQEVLSYFGIASPDQLAPVWEDVYSSTQEETFRDQFGSVAAWLRQGEIQAMELETKPYSEYGLKELVEKPGVLALSSKQDFYLRLQQAYAQAGVAVCVVKEIPGCDLALATHWLAPHKALIQISERYCSSDLEFFSVLYRGVGHLLLHGKRQVFLEHGGENPHDDKEIQARQFAEEFIQRLAQAEFFDGRRIMVAKVKEVSDDAQIVPEHFSGLMSVLPELLKALDIDVEPEMDLEKQFGQFLDEKFREIRRTISDGDQNIAAGELYHTWKVFNRFAVESPLLQGYMSMIMMLWGQLTPPTSMSAVAQPIAIGISPTPLPIDLFKLQERNK
jgi:HTH-type transcriptional regulator/antitoxin HigA